MTPPRDGDGFRLRGLQMTRIETFTDAAFAFALTLLVISLDPPMTMAGLRSAFVHVPSFILSAILLMVFWFGHHRWSRRYGMDDGVSITLSCLLVFTVLVFVYPLRYMTSALTGFISWVSGLPIGPDQASLGITGFADVNRMFVIYGLGFMSMATAILLLNLHAWRQRDALDLDDVERVATRAEIGAWLILLAVGMASTLIAAALPNAVPTAGWAYALLAVVMPLYGRRARRPRRPTGPVFAIHDAVD